MARTYLILLLTLSMLLAACQPQAAQPTAAPIPTEAAGQPTQPTQATAVPVRSASPAATMEATSAPAAALQPITPENAADLEELYKMRE